MSVSERFKRLPEEQLLRNEESARQAREASELLKRLKSTRQEAERLAKEEIERTRRMLNEEVEVNPEIVELKRKLRNADREKESWERKQKDHERSLNFELETLKKEEVNLLNRFNQEKEAEINFQKGLENFKNERSEKEEKFNELGRKLDKMKQEEEPRFNDDLNVLRRKINDLEHQVSTDDYDSVRRQLSQIENEIRTLQESYDRTKQESSNYEEKKKKAGLDLLKAQEMVQDSKVIENDKIKQLEDLKERIDPENYKNANAQKELIEAETQLKELKSTHEGLLRDKNARNEMITAKTRKIKHLQSEIRKLQDESVRLELELSDDHDANFDIENQVIRSEMTLKDAQERLNYIRGSVEFYASERSRYGDQVSKLENEISNLRKTRAAAEIEEKKADELCDEIERHCVNLDTTINRNFNRISDLNDQALNLQSKLRNFDALNKEIEEAKKLLNQVHVEFSEWQKGIKGPIQEEYEKLNAWLNAHPLPGVISAPKSNLIWNDHEKIRNRINELQSRSKVLPINFDDPERLRIEIGNKEKEICEKLASRKGPMSPRFVNQLEREAEVLMRAQAAAAVELKQESIERETFALSKLRFSRHPQVALDEEARNKLWKLNQETAETGPIADQVLELCQNKNITVKQEE